MAKFRMVHQWAVLMESSLWALNHRVQNSPNRSFEIDLDGPRTLLFCSDAKDVIRSLTKEHKQVKVGFDFFCHQISTAFERLAVVKREMDLLPKAVPDSQDKLGDIVELLLLAKRARRRLKEDFVSIADSLGEDFFAGRSDHWDVFVKRTGLVLSPIDGDEFAIIDVGSSPLTD
jgi:hypothetical protein